MKILSINMWLLPFRLSKHNFKRVKILCEVINKKKPDLIAIQEVWSINYIKYLEKNIKNYYIIHTTKKKLNISGLVTLSKYKPLSFKFYPFKKNKEMNFIEKNVLKGCLETKYRLNGKIIHFLNTHLYSPNKESQKKITKNQFEFIKSKINSNGLSILCGDLNFDIKYFERVNNCFFSYAENEKITISSENNYLKKWWDKNVKGNKKIDYILIRTSKNFVFKSETIKENLSDHYGIFTQILFK